MVSERNRLNQENSLFPPSGKTLGLGALSNLVGIHHGTAIQKKGVVGIPVKLI